MYALNRYYIKSGRRLRTLPVAAFCVRAYNLLGWCGANGVPESAGGFEHVGVCAAHKVGIDAVGYAGVAEVLALGAVAGDAHDDASRHSSGFLQSAECAASSV